MVLSDPELTQAVSKILLRSERVAYVAERFQLDNDNNQFSAGADRRSWIYPIADQLTACCNPLCLLEDLLRCPSWQWQVTELGLPAHPGALNPHTISEWGS